METYIVQLGCLGNFGMGDLYEVVAEDEYDAFCWAANEDGGKQALSPEDAAEVPEEDLLRPDFGNAAYLSSEVSVRGTGDASCGCDGREGVLRKGVNYGDRQEWEPLP